MQVADALHRRREGSAPYRAPVLLAFAAITCLLISQAALTSLGCVSAKACKRANNNNNAQMARL